jgi:hypothetical protein
MIQTTENIIGGHKVMKTKLYRNLKHGDKILVADATNNNGSVGGRTAIVTVSCVQETRSGRISGKRQWAVHGNYPWWFSGPILAYSTDRTELVSD